MCWWVDKLLAERGIAVDHVTIFRSDASCIRVGTGLQPVAYILGDDQLWGRGAPP